MFKFSSSIRLTSILPQKEVSHTHVFSLKGLNKEQLRIKGVSAVTDGGG